MAPSNFLPLDRLRGRARDLGLSVGAAVAEPGAEVERYRQWVAEGRQGEMAWLGRNIDRRTDPRRVLDGAQSVVAVALNYHPGPLPPPKDDRPRGRIAAYALGDDYHDVLLEKVRALASALDDPKARPYVDTGPVLEKPWAQRAGLGWVGKHTNAVSRTLGSWWFVGTVLTRSEIEPSSEHEDHCGSCTRCIEVCPTGALRMEEPYKIDARRCISYLTIELRGSIPRALRPLIGDWIFGCDLCLDVCPWNRFAEPSGEPRFEVRPYLVTPALEDLLGWDQETFSRLLRGSPIKRTKRRGLLRNVAVAMGNSGDRSVVPALAGVLDGEPEPVVRAHAAWALGVLGGGAAQVALERHRRDPDPTVVEEVEAALRGEVG